MSDSTWVKLILAISLDGRISLKPNIKANLGSKGDRKVLEKALAWSDASLIGAETIRIHQNTCLIHNQKLIEKRKLKNRSLQPIALVVSRKRSFNENLSFFKQPIHRWLITTQTGSDDNLNKGFERQIILKENWSETLKSLKHEGISKIALLGGSQLAGSFLKEDQIDELQLTISPKLLGGKSLWSPFSEENLPINLWHDNSWLLKKVKQLGESEINIKYFRNRKN